MSGRSGSISMKEGMSSLVGVVLILLCIFPVVPSRAYARGWDLQAFGRRSFAPYTFVNDGNVPDGFLVDILKAAMPSYGHLDIKLGVWQQLASGENSGRNPDVLVGISFKEASSEVLDHTEFLVDTSKPGFSIDRFQSESSQSISGKDIRRLWFYIPVDDITFSFFGREKNTEKASLKDTYGRDIVTIRGSEADRYLGEHTGTWHVIAAESGAEAIYMVLSGEADYALLGTYHGKYLLDRLAMKEISSVEDPLFSVSQGFVVTDGNIYLASGLLKGLSMIRGDGTFDEIHKKWFAPYRKRSIDPSIVLKIVSAGVTVIIVFLLWTFSLKKQVNRIVREREKIMDFTRDGIVAIDREGKISLLNRTAVKLAGLGGNERGCDVDLCIPELGLSDVLKTGEAVHDLEQNVNGRVLVINKAPVKVGSDVVGAIATFRDMTEIRTMAQEITGVKMYVESLRVQNHEFLNKLQAISGLIQLGKYDKAIDFISSERQEWQSITSFVSEHIENFVVGGILVGKIGRCRELGIEFFLDPDCTCGENPAVGDQSLVTIIGNLLENSIENLKDLKGRKPKIEFSVFDESGRIMISVRDNGSGIENDIREKIFQRGFSTKKNGSGPCGYGLYSIKMMVDALEGDILLDSVPGEYTEFVVTLPNRGD